MQLNHQTPQEYDKKLNLLVLPTTAGTGAEATQFSTGLG